MQQYFCVKLGMTPTLTYDKMTAANMNYIEGSFASGINVSEVGKKVLKMIPAAGNDIIGLNL